MSKPGADPSSSEPVGQEAFAVICEAMRGKAMVALARLVLSRTCLSKKEPVEIPKPDGDATFPEIVESAFKHMGM